MTAEEFLRDLALRVEVVQVAPTDLDESEDIGEYVESSLVVQITPHDADEFLALTGIRIE